MAIKLSEVVSLTGIPGLHKVIKTDSKNVIIESLDETKKRQMVRANMMVSKLTEISMYVENDGNEELSAIFKSMEDKYGKELPVNKKSSNDELMAFLAEVLPNYAQGKVYPSNVKKLVQWYEVLAANEVSFEKEAVEPTPTEETSTEETAAEEAVTEAVEAK